MRALLNRLLRPRLPPEVEFSCGSFARETPTSGLIVISVGAKTREPRELELRLFFEGREGPDFIRRLSLSPTQTDHWVAVHGHLLPNGPVNVRLELGEPDGVALAVLGITIQVRNEGPVAEQVAASLRARRTPLVLDGEVNSGVYDYGDPALTAWFDRGPEAVEAHLAGLADRGEATPEELAALRHFAENGFLTMPEALDAGLVGRVNAALDDAVARRVEGYEWGSSQRIHNLHDSYPAIRELWLHPKILRMLALIQGAPARPCQSLTYLFGSQQEHHQDTIHLTPFPAGRMCGVWTALEDVQPDSGELAVFPRSHRLPRVYMDTVGLPKVRDEVWEPFQARVVPLWTDLINRAGLAREVYRPKAGSVLIWHENLMHAGSPRRDLTRSRRSIVGHYFAEGSVVYYDSSGLAGAVYEGELPTA